MAYPRGPVRRMLGIAFFKSRSAAIPICSFSGSQAVAPCLRPDPKVLRDSVIDRDDVESEPVAVVSRICKC